MLKKLLLAVCLAAIHFNSHSEETPKSHSSLYFIPFQATFGIAEEVPGYHATLGYERVLKKNEKWSWQLPISIGSLKTHFISGYHRQGFNAYIAPGVAFHPRGYGDKYNIHYSGHMVLGAADYQSWTKKHSYQSNDIYWGLLANAHFGIPITKRTSIITTVGVGGRINVAHQSTPNYITPVPSYNYVKFYFMFNTQVGLQFKL